MKSFSFKLILFIFLVYQSLNSQIKFAWISDTHIGSPNAESDLLEIVNDINKHNVKFIIITGDITEKGLNSELLRAKEILKQLNRPYFIIPGNHDTKWSESGCTKFNEIFGDNKFIFYYEDYCFIGINSGIPLRGGGGHIAVEDLEWLKSKLNKLNSNTKIIFAVHHQLDKEIDNYKEVINLLSRFNNVFVLVGHGHANREYNFDGLKGAMGRSSLRKGKTPGYNLVELFDDSISIKSIDFEMDKVWYKNSLYKNEKADNNIVDLKNLKSSQIFNTKSTVVKTGVLIGNNLFFADLSGKIYSIKLSSKINWEKYFPTSFFARPAVYKNKVVFCGADGNVYFLNRFNGQLLRKINLSSSIIATPVIHKNNLIVFTNNGKINFINLNTFETKSFKVADKNFETVPLLFDGNIIIGNWDSYLYSLNANFDDSIIINWKWTENKNFYYSPAACSPVIDNLKRIYISTPDKFISAIDFQTGKTLFRSNEFNSWESIGIDENKSILFIKGLIDTLYAIDLEDSKNKLKWKTSLEYGLDTNPVPISEKFGLVFIPAKNGVLYIVNKNNGKILDKIFLGNARLNDVIVINKNTIVISNMDGKFYRIKLNSR